MRVIRLALVNAATLWRRFIGLAVLTSLGVGACLSALTLSSNAEQAARERVTEGVALRSVEIQRTDDRPNGSAITPDGIKEIQAIPEVAAVEPTVQATFGIKTKDVPGALLYGALLRPSQQPPIVESVRAKLFPLRGDETVLPAKVQGISLTPLLSQRVDIDYQQTTGEGEGRGAHGQLTVVGFYDPTWQLDGPDTAYLAEAQLITLAAARAGLPRETFLSTRGYDKATVVAKTAADVATLLTTLQERGYSATSLQQQLTELPGVLRLIQIAGRLLFGALIAFVLLGAITLSSALVRQRTREIGLLQAVGYRSRSILALFLLEMGIVGVLAAVIGVVLGVGGGAVLADRLGHIAELRPYVSSGHGMPAPGLVMILLAVVPAAMVIGGLLPARRGARMEPSVALRDW